jgi:hypothetical protein
LAGYGKEGDEECQNCIQDYKWRRISPPTHQDIPFHMIFDIKVEDVRRKARFVADGHITDTPYAMTYASVVSRESVRVALKLAALNDMDVKMADVENAYMTAPITEKVWTLIGPEFKDDPGKRSLIAKALYGFNSAGAAFRNHLAECMKQLGWNPFCVIGTFG